MSQPAPTSHRFQLCTIEQATEITLSSEHVSGTLVLSRCDDAYQFHWTPLDGTPTQHVTAAISSPSRIPDDVWQPNVGFKVACSDVSRVTLHENPLSMTIRHSCRDCPRTFSFSESEFVSMTELLEQLISNGIAVPSPDEEYSLTFYSRCHRNVYPYTPPQIRMSGELACDLSVLWDELHRFFQALIINLAGSNMLPKDTSFPLDRAAEACHKRVLRTIDEYAKTVPKYEKIGVGEWAGLFDGEGRVKDPEMFRKRVFHEGIDTALLPQALPFVFGVFELDSTEEERKALNAELEEEFSRLLMQVQSFDRQQLENNRRLENSFKIIRHDVHRTDRGLPAFKGENATGLKMLTSLLQTYCIFNPPIGYLQGMNDLFVPILLAFLPNWSDSGEPVDSDGNTVDYTPYLSPIFWCFDAMMRNINHLRLLASVTDECKRKAKDIHDIIMKVSPIAGIWIQKVQIQELLWIYSDLVLLFKRSLPNQLWPVWLQLNCAPHPDHWLTYFVAAVIVLAFDELTRLPNQQITTLMDAFPRILETIGKDHRKIGVTALWLAEMVPPAKSQAQEKEEMQMESFRFFETDWTGLSQSRQCFGQKPS